MRRRGESGFALLLVFVLAAAIAIGLFVEVPRIAFESQRTREQLFIDRGLGYKRAIQLFYRKYRTYPQTLDDLETKRNIRFLRQRYADPLTGENYRLLHVGPAGQITDSLIQTANPLQSGKDDGSNSLGANSTIASTATSPTLSPDGQPMEPFDPLNMAARRPSDHLTPTGSALPEPDQNQESPPVQYAQTGQLPNPGQPTSAGFSGQPQLIGQAGQPSPPQDPTETQNPNQIANPGQTQFPGQPFQPQGFSQLSQQNTGRPGQPAPYAGQSGAPGASPNFPQNPAQPLQGGAGNTPQQALPQQNQAANAIQQGLPTPLQPPASVATLFGGIAGGIVGVASNAGGRGIHVINDHSKYKEWELIYDLRKDKTALGGMMFPQLPLQTNGAPGMNVAPQSHTIPAR